MNIIEAMDDLRYFRRLFRDPETWSSWKVFFKALFAIPMTERNERRLFRDCTGLKRPRNRPAREAYIIAGRRSGKSSMCALLAVYLAIDRDWSRYINPGETGYIFVIAPDRNQARIIMRYISGIFQSNEMFRELIDGDPQDETRLKNGIVIAVKTCNYRTVRGFTALAVICDEIAFWNDENSANPAQEVLAALRPSLATIPDSMLIGISSPYSKSGVLWEQFTNNFRNADNGAPLIWKAPTRIMNPTIDNRIIEDAMRQDPVRARAEWFAEWREENECFLSQETIESAVIPGRIELPKLNGVRYFGYIDPSGGRQDSFTLAIGHKEEGGKIIVDCVREAMPPFRPQEVVYDFSRDCQRYGISHVEGDRYAGEWVPAEFGKHGVVVNNSNLSSSEIYLSFLPLLMNGSVELLDNRRLKEQLRRLQRRTRAGGRDLISHGPGAHDDLAMAVAGVSILASGQSEPFSTEGLAQIMFGEPEITEEEDLLNYVTNWLLGRLKKPWRAKDDLND